MADAETPKLITEHLEADAAIRTLRDIAMTLKTVGDENVKLDKGLGELRGKQIDLEQQLSEMRDSHELLKTWGDVIADYERGILDRAELFDRTIREAHDD